MAPFDHEHSLLPLEASATCTLEVEGITREFLLKVIGGWVYFVPAPQTDFEPVFGIATPFEGGNVAAFFRAEFEKGNWGYFNMDDRDEVVFLWCPNAKVGVRAPFEGCQFTFFEWPGISSWHLSDWLHMELETVEQMRIWRQRRKLLRRFPINEYAAVFEPFGNELERWKTLQPSFKEVRPASRPHKTWLPRVEKMETQWLRGDEEMCEELVTAVVWDSLAADFWTEKPSIDLCFHASDFRGPCGTEVGWRSKWKGKPVDILERPQTAILLGLVERQMWVVGWEFEQQRGTWQLLTDVWEWTVAAPSAHDRLEAALILDKWLLELEAQGELEARDAQLIREWPFGELEGETKTELDFEYSALYSRLFSSFPRDAAFFRAQWEREVAERNC